MRSALRSPRRSLPLALLVVLLVALAGGAAFVQSAVDGGGDPSGAALYTAAQAERGGELYGQHCQSCHAANLRAVDPFPPLTGAAFFASWQGRPVAELYGYIRQNMPLGAEGSLDDQTYADILAYWLSRHGYIAGDSELPLDPAELPEVPVEPHDETAAGGG